jgi:hypothetical protein
VADPKLKQHLLYSVKLRSTEAHAGKIQESSVTFRPTPQRDGHSIGVTDECHAQRFRRPPLPIRFDFKCRDKLLVELTTLGDGIRLVCRMNGCNMQLDSMRACDVAGCFLCPRSSLLTALLI